MKKMGKNILIMGLGDAGNKLLLFLLTPFYTYFLSPKEYGIADLITMGMTALLPLLTLSIADAVFRFYLDAENPKKVLSTALFVWFHAVVLVAVAWGVASFILGFSWLVNGAAILVVAQSLYVILQQQIRAMNQLVLYSISGFTVAVVLLVSNVICLKYLHLGVTGFVFSQALSFLVAGALFLLFGRVLPLFSLRQIDFMVLKKMLRYSAPLMPNALLWWVLQVGNRYLMLFFFGGAAAGLYTAATKIPNLLLFFHQIFFKAWSLVALEEKKEDQKTLFHTVFSFYAFLYFFVVALLLCVVRPLIGLLFSSDYQGAVIFIPFLLLGMSFSAFSSFVETSYMVEKKTGRLMTNSLIGCLVSLTFTLCFIPLLGAVAAPLATFIGFLTTWLIRMIDVGQLRHLPHKWRFFGTLSLLLVNSIYLTWGPSSFSPLVVISLSSGAMFLQMPVWKKIGTFLIRKTRKN